MAITREKLYQLRIIEQKTLSEIAKIYSVSRTRVWQRLKKEKLDGKLSKKIKTTVCIICGTQFTRTSRTTCSETCLSRSKANKIGGQWSRRIVQELTCDYCNIKFRRSNYQIAQSSGQHKFCSHRCRNMFHNENK